MLYIASDHAGYQLKEHLVKYLKNQLKINASDMGPNEFVADDDFPDYAIPLAKKVVENKENRGILICGGGNGMCIAANRIKGALGIVGYNIQAAESGRKDENANILCLAGRIISEDHANAIVKKFLETKFNNEERFVRRIKKIEALEK